MSDVLRLSAREQLRAMRSGELSPVELCDQTLAQAEHTADLQAFLTIDRDTALAAARESEARLAAGNPRPLEGLPIPLKDVEATAGMRTTNGTLLMADNVPEQDGATAAAIRASGANIFGKTNTCAFAFTDDSTNLFGLTSRNPVDPTRSAGGSSGGAASAVGGGVCRIAHATDGGGSARQPAALCGLVGYKPTFGRVPRYPMTDMWNARSHAGVIAKTVDDVAVAMSGFARFDPRDPLSVWEEVAWTEIPRRPVDRPLRIAYFPTWGDGRLDSNVASVIEQGVQKLVDYGCELVEPTVDTSSMVQVFEDNYSAQFAYDLRDQMDRRDLIDEGVLRAYDYGRSMTLLDFLASRDRRGQFNARMVALFDEIDFFVSPAQPCESWVVGTPPMADGVSLAGFGSFRLQSLALFNLTGWPAISIPCGRTVNDLPVGIHIAAMRGRDVPLLQFAYEVESLLSS